jgi:hypothetical protein
MNNWTAEELDTIGAAEELELAPRRDDGTLRKPVPVWVVRPEARATMLKLVPR